MGNKILKDKIVIIAYILFLMFSPLIIAFSYQWIMEMNGVTVQFSQYFGIHSLLFQ
ncbi:MAG: hypothetical protein ACI9XO_003617 [Paraglaciecola sp.]|jgi:hypothetical protein